MTPRTQARPNEIRERERALARLATQQHGVVARRQLVALGFRDEGIKLRLDAGRLQHLHHEVYAVGHSRLSQRGHWMAAVLAYGENALLSHKSAAVLWGIAGRRSGAIHVTAPVGRQGIHRRAGLWIHRGRLTAEDGEVHAGIPVTTVARTLFDLAEAVSFSRLASAWEEADRLGLLHLHAVAEVCERGHGRRALKPVRRLLSEARAPVVTRSQLEDSFARFCDEYRLPTPIFNATVLDLEVDAIWPARRLIVELDGFAFHRHRAAFERDRSRDAALQVAGYRTIRVTYRRLHDEPGVVARELRILMGVAEQKGQYDPANSDTP